MTVVWPVPPETVKQRKVEEVQRHEAILMIAEPHAERDVMGAFLESRAWAVIRTVLVVRSMSDQCSRRSSLVLSADPKFICTKAVHHRLGEPAKMADISESVNKSALD